MSVPRPVGRFPTTQRVRKRPEFQRIQAGGRRVTTPHCVLLLYARDPDQAAAEARLGITVTRKVGTAVTRNRAKRVVREAFRATRELWPPDVDLVVIVRRAGPELTLAGVVAEWREVRPALHRRVQEARMAREKRQSALAP